MDSTTCWRRWSSSIPQPRPGVGQRHNEREARHLHFALLADFEPKGGVARAYGAYRSAEGVSERALFLIVAEILAGATGLEPATSCVTMRSKQLNYAQAS